MKYSKGDAHKTLSLGVSLVKIGEGGVLFYTLMGVNNPVSVRAKCFV